MKVADTVAQLRGTVGNFVDAKGNPTDDTDGVEGSNAAPVFTSSDESVATVEADPADANSCIVTFSGALGTTQISADFNGGASNADAGGFSAVGDLEVVPGQAISASLSFAPVTP